MQYKAEEFKLTKSDFPRMWSSKYRELYIIQSPVSNCQHCSIGGFENLLNNSSVMIGRSLKEIQKVIEYDRNNFIVEVSYRYSDQINKLFKNRIRSESKYISSNGKLRILYIISFTKIKK